MSDPHSFVFSLTERQQSLLDRLQQLGTWANEGRLPIDAIEILGFGSFFRGKPKPKDVDILIRDSGERSKRFELFVHLLKEVRTNYANNYEYKSPLPAFLEVFDEHHSGMFPGLIDMNEERSVFESWIEMYSWQMLFPSTIAEQVSWDSPQGFTKRFIRKNFPSINIAFFLLKGQRPKDVGMWTEYVSVIWSRECKDVTANLASALSDDSIATATRSELDSFDRQLFRVCGTSEVLKELIDLLSKSRRSKTSHDHPHAWLQKWFEQLNSKPVELGTYRAIVDDDSLITTEEMRSERGREDVRSVYDLRIQQLGDLVEQKRSQLKNEHDLADVRREVFRALSLYKARCVATETKPVGFVRQAVESNKKLRAKCVEQVLEELAAMLKSK